MAQSVILSSRDRPSRSGRGEVGMVRWSGAKIAGVLAACGLVLAACGKPAGQTGASASGSSSAAANRQYTVAWTIYAGWMPWPYAEQAGIVKKWADKYGVKIKLVQVNDYVESLNQFSA